MGNNGLHVRPASAAASVCYAVYAAVMAWIALCDRLPVAARADDKPAMEATGPSIATELSHLGALKFNTRLQDAADENVFDDLAVMVTISDVIADSHQCHISYRRRVEREQRSSDQQRSLALADVDEVKVEPFESFENEHQGKAGWVYTMTDPEISAVVIAHGDDMMDWFAVMGAEAAKHLAEDIRRQGDYCRRHATR